MEHFGTFIRGLPALSAIATALQGMQTAKDGIIGVPVELPDGAVEGIHPLLAIMCDISVEEFKAYPVWDGFAILMALIQFLPNLETAADSKELTPSTPSLPG